MSIPFFKCLACGRHSHDNRTDYICDECRAKGNTSEDSEYGRRLKEIQEIQNRLDKQNMQDKQHYGLIGVRSNVGSPDKPKHSD